MVATGAMSRCISPSILRFKQIEASNSIAFSDRSGLLKVTGAVEEYQSDCEGSVCGRTAPPPLPSAPPPVRLEAWGEDAPTAPTAPSGHPQLSATTSRTGGRSSFDGAVINCDIVMAIERLSMLSQDGRGAPHEDICDILAMCESGFRKWTSTYNVLNSHIYSSRQALQDMMAATIHRRSQFSERLRVLACNRNTSATADLIERSEAAVAIVRKSAAALMPTNPPLPKDKHPGAEDGRSASQRKRGKRPCLAFHDTAPSASAAPALH